MIADTIANILRQQLRGVYRSCRRFQTGSVRGLDDFATISFMWSLPLSGLMKYTEMNTPDSVTGLKHTPLRLIVLSTIPPASVLFISLRYILMRRLPITYISYGALSVCVLVANGRLALQELEKNRLCKEMRNAWQADKDGDGDEEYKHWS